MYNASKQAEEVLNLKMKYRLLSCIESRVENNRNFYGRFQLGPFDLGQGITIANSLRRSLLSEVFGLAITAIEIRGATHEYAHLPGVRESVLDLLLNLKKIVLTSDFQIQKPQIGYLQVEGPGKVKANDLKLPISIQCVDPEQHIATLVSNGSLKMKFMICRGRTFLFQKPLGLKDRSKTLPRSFRQKIKRNLSFGKTSIYTTESNSRKARGISTLYSVPSIEYFKNNNFPKTFSYSSCVLNTQGEEKDNFYFDSNDFSFSSKEKEKIEGKPLYQVLFDHADHGTSKIFASHVPKGNEVDPASLVSLQNNRGDKQNLTQITDKTVNNSKNLIKLKSWTQKRSIFTFVDGGSFLNKMKNSSFSSKNSSEKAFQTFATTQKDFDLVNKVNPLVKSKSPKITKNNDLKISDINVTNFENQNWNALPIDTVFMPINQVNFAIEIDNDYDFPKERVILEVWTNGSIHPRQAIHEASKALIKLIIPFHEPKQNFWLEPNLRTIFFNSPRLLQKTLQKRSKNFKSLLTKSEKQIYELKGKNITSLDIGNLDLSLRPYTCLKQANIETVADLLKYSREDLLNLKNFGKKSLDEIENNLNQLGFKLRTSLK